MGWWTDLKRSAGKAILKATPWAAGAIAGGVCTAIGGPAAGVACGALATEGVEALQRSVDRKIESASPSASPSSEATVVYPTEVPPVSDPLTLEEVEGEEEGAGEPALASPETSGAAVRWKIIGAGAAAVGLGVYAVKKWRES